MLKHRQTIHFPTSAKPQLTCDEPGCEKSFSAKGNLTKHVRSLHSGFDQLYPWVCEVKGCYKRFTRKHILAQHGRVLHEGCFDWKCDEIDCGKSFGFKHHLTKHQTSIHNLKASVNVDMNRKSKKSKSIGSSIKIKPVVAAASHTVERFSAAAIMADYLSVLPPLER
eukprot:Plantae.Rhodophyta-Palmaria_palmata.ctg2249.p1 GENE.Plantae.Rhodophyta-Palmaria_palmata.ctg2249~~Plantae.Rhodophyta-Palmaria_palmata.ctg2249.p1  ORF type:complete len:187 (+),score=16.00 Plantae.Rhodophyta-Palmaria_palmata.ctg2249:63-563(+)